MLILGKCQHYSGKYTFGEGVAPDPRNGTVPALATQAGYYCGRLVPVPRNRMETSGSAVQSEQCRPSQRYQYNIFFTILERNIYFIRMMLTPFQSSLVPQPACTPFLGSGWRHPDLRYNQNNAKLSSGNQCGSVSWIRNNIFEPHVFFRIMLTLLSVRCCPRRLAPFGTDPDGYIKIQNTTE